MTIGRPINYFGTKDRLAKRIISLVPPECDTWVDLFCGSAIVTLRKPRHKREVINDINGEIVNLFSVLRNTKQLTQLMKFVELTPYAQDELNRAQSSETPSDPVERAWHFLIVSWMGRAGSNAHRTGFRWSKGQTTAPELSWCKLPERLVSVANRLRGVCVRSVPALKLIDSYDVGNCILYVDPPYPGPVGRRYKHKMNDDEHKKLAERLAQCKARVILSMNPDTIYSEILKDWQVHRVNVTGGGTNTKQELILTNYTAPYPLATAPKAVKFDVQAMNCLFNESGHHECS
ncbi:DNA adenine methylase [Thalassospira profundimaris]|uniref:DNA adenine methylase n=1 Tax=Thalassospira profundimaris TaxID=502049 RepID=UPI0015F07911|nr:DNA adenine methylase [Thalassospira profundimaris]